MKNENQFRRARRAGVPLVAYETGDPWATIAGCLAALNGKAETTPCLQWDCLRGLVPLNEAGREAQAKRGPAREDSVFLPTCLAALLDPMPDGGTDDPIRLPPGAVVFFHNAQRFLEDPAVIQGFCNLRNSCKCIGATLVMMGPGFTLPPEIKDDVVQIDEPSPGQEDITRIITSTVGDVRAAEKEQGREFPEPDVSRVAETLLGYRSEFSAEQSLALAVDRSGVDMDRLWDLKVAALRKTAGLDISLPKGTFADLAGCEGVKHFLGMYLRGRNRPHGVFLLDEVEKMSAGASGGDLSGTSQAMLEQFLSWVESKKVQGLLLVGVPGAGKTRTAECTAGEAGVPLLRGSMSTVKGSLVGQSEQNMKQLLRAVDSVSQGQPLMLGTCNSLDNLPPEMMARFKLGIMFWDYPDAEEQAALWAYYMRKYELGGEAPSVRNWVGREIESCCNRAWLFGCSVEEAALTVVPVSVASAGKMEALRQSASGRFLSAAHPGPYQYQSAPGAFVVQEQGNKRRINL